eukprot:7134868-Prymnesium_polylepis.1
MADAHATPPANAPALAGLETHRLLPAAMELIDADGPLCARAEAAAGGEGGGEAAADADDDDDGDGGDGEGADSLSEQATRLLTA